MHCPSVVFYVAEWRFRGDNLVPEIKTFRFSMSFKEFLMKKLIIAASILTAFAGVAQAQSNLVIYGTADASFDVVTGSGATKNAAGNEGDLASRSRVSSNSSYIGFRGVEDLGNGLKAQFQIESAVDMSGKSADTGSTENNGWANRDSFVGMSGSLGAVRLGYQSTPHRVVATTFDLLPDAAGAGSSLNLIGKVNMGALLNPVSATGTTEQVIGETNAGANGTIDNTYGVIGRSQSIVYVAPTYEGFTGMVAFTGNDARDNRSAGAGLASRNPYAWNLAGTYVRGQFKVGYSFLAAKDGGSLDGITAAGLNALSLTGNERTYAHLLGASYDFGQGTVVSGMYDRIDGRLDGAAMSDLKFKRTAYTLGVKHTVGKHSGLFAYTHAGDTDYSTGGRALGNAGDNGASQYTLRYGYEFSKRTQGYVQYVRLNNGNNAAYDVGSSVSSNSDVAAGSNLNVLGVGMRHSF